MMSFSRRLSLLFICLFCVAAATRGFRISGTIEEYGTKKAIGGVVVKVKYNGRILAYSVCGKDGTFSFEVPDSVTVAAVVEFSGRRYASRTIKASEIGTDRNVYLQPQSSELAEVIVRPVTVREKGDTLIYNVDAIRNISDRTIEDVIARLPGISISGGQISYNGEPINRFYIEGLDGLGGNYSIATKNIRAEDVNSIDLYENHEPRQVVRDRSLSKNAALNIRLKKRSLLKPAGHIAGGSGKRGNVAAWMAKAFGMLVAPGAQIYFDAAGNNFGIPAGKGGNYSSPLQLPVSNMLNISAVESINIPASLYVKSRTARSSASFAVKTGKYGTLRGTIGYGYLRSGSDGTSITVYPLSDGMNERQLTQTGHDLRRHQGGALNISYEHNAPRLYINDELTAGISFKRNSSFISAEPGGNIIQRLDNNDVVINNRLEVISRSDSHIWKGNMSLDLHNMPVNSILARNPVSESMIACQSARAEGFRIDASTDFGWNVGSQSTIGLTLKIRDEYMSIGTSGQRGAALEPTGTNTPRGNTAEAALGSSYRLASKGLSFETGLPFELIIRNFRSLADSKRYDKATVHFAPYASISLRLPHEVKGNMSLNFSRSYSGIENFITAPIITSYRSEIIPGTGFPSASSLWNASTAWSWRRIPAGFLTSLTINLMGRESEKMISADISDKDISTRYADIKNRLTRFNSVLSLSKLLLGQRATLKLDLAYSLSSNRMIRNGDNIPVKNSQISAAISFSAPLFSDRLAIKPALMMNISRQNSDNVFSRTSRIWQAVFPMTGLIFKGLDVTVSPDFRSNPFYGSRRMNVFILDMNARYRVKQWEFEIRLNNLTDRRTYSVENCNDLIYTYREVKLSGMDALLSIRYNF